MSYVKFNIMELKSILFLFTFVISITVTFSQSGNIEYSIKDIEGNLYNTVRIGNQVWMEENLKTKKYNDQSSIQNITNDYSWSIFTRGAYCWLFNEQSHGNAYGMLYNWYAVNSDKLCPSGWHVPTDYEWKTLSLFLGGNNISGGKLKSLNGWSKPNSGATNESRFSALPGGIRGGNGLFGNEDFTFWWTSSKVNANYISAMEISSNSTYFERVDAPKSSGLSVRCIKD